jgi:hypothetical protein
LSAALRVFSAICHPGAGAREAALGPDREPVSVDQIAPAVATPAATTPTAAIIAVERRRVVSVTSMIPPITLRESVISDNSIEPVPAIDRVGDHP